MGKAEPDIYAGGLNTSQRKVGLRLSDAAESKYFDMIKAWGGWGLFQELLNVLHEIAVRRGVDVSNVAARWVLERPETGVVIVGKQGFAPSPAKLLQIRIPTRSHIAYPLHNQNPHIRLPRARRHRNRGCRCKKSGPRDVRADWGLR